MNELKKPPYKIKCEIFFDSIELSADRMLFVCDPELNTKCTKEHCEKECTMTSDIWCAKRFDIVE